MFRAKNRIRRGFTMIELMVVITIIALLLSIATGAMFSLIAGARENATSTTIGKIDQILKERVVGFGQIDFTDAGARFQTAWVAAGNLPVSSQLAEVIERKQRMKSAFPQNFLEMLANDGTLNPRYSNLSTLLSPPPGFVSKFESGIVLYALLVNGETFGAPTVGTDVFTSSEVRISSETANLPCLVDAWGEPLRFYRWPTRLFKPAGPGTTFPVDRTFATLLVPNVGNIAPYTTTAPNPTQWFGPDGLAGIAGVGGQGVFGSDDVPNVGADGFPGIASKDDDGDGSVDNMTELGWPGSDDFEPLNFDSDDGMFLLLGSPVLPFGPAGSVLNTPLALNFEQFLHTPFTFHPMLIVSAGADRQLGLGEPNDTSTGATGTFGYLAAPTSIQFGTTVTLQQLTANYSQLLDNYTNLNLTGSGK